MNNRYELEVIQHPGKPGLVSHDVSAQHVSSCGNRTNSEKIEIFTQLYFCIQPGIFVHNVCFPFGLLSGYSIAFGDFKKRAT